MGRGSKGLLDELTVLPWPVGLVVGVLGFLAIRHGVPAWFSGQGGPFSQAFAQSNPLALLEWIFLAACAMASFFSFLGSRRKRRLLDTRTGLDSIAALGWRDFEQLVGEAFRRQGYAVEETGLGGADGGIDLILRRDGKRILVQCKQWRRQKVPVNVAREMYGLLAHHGADEVCIATLGGFTPDAAPFVEGKPIELIDGPALLEMIRGVQQATEAGTSHRQWIEPATDASVASKSLAADCPRCGAHMVERRNRQAGNLFWGCSAYPRCTGTRGLEK